MAEHHATHSETPAGSHWAYCTTCYGQGGGALDLGEFTTQREAQSAVEAHIGELTALVAADQEKKASWIVISAAEFQAALNRVHAGEHPWMVYLEVYANSDHERIGGDGRG